jgi:hypothetical protein
MQDVYGKGKEKRGKTYEEGRREVRGFGAIGKRQDVDSREVKM